MKIEENTLYLTRDGHVVKITHIENHKVVVGDFITIPPDFCRAAHGYRWSNTGSYYGTERHVDLVKELEQCDIANILFT